MVNTKKVKDIIKEEFEKSNTPGLVFGLFNEEGLLYQQSCGYYNLENKVPVESDTRFMIGSITKLFTVIAFMQQWEKGRIKLTDRVNDYLPKGKIILKKGWPEVTFEHLLTHTSGIGELRRFRDIFKKGFRLLTYDSQPIPPLSYLHDLPVYPSSPAGLKYAYSNIGVSLLGYVIEQLEDMSFRDYILEHIIEPLGMTHSDLIRSDQIRVKEAFGYKFKKGKYKYAKRWNNIIKPSGAIVSSLEDMAKFGQMILNKGHYNGGKLLRKDTFDLMWTPHYFAHEKLKERHSIGLIFWLHNINDQRFIQHTGSVMGFNAAFGIFPDQNIGYFTCCNLQEGLHHRTTYRIRNRLVKLLTEFENAYKKSSSPDPSFIDNIPGCYGGYPGFLTNTRIITEGIQFKVKKKNSHLEIKGLIGPQKDGERLYPTEDPLVYQSIHEDEGEYLYFTRKYVFDKNEKNEIIRLNRNFEKLRRLNFYQRLSFKIVLIFGLLAFIILLLILL